MRSPKYPTGSVDDAHLALGDLLVILGLLGRVRALSGLLDRVHGLLGAGNVRARITVPAE